MTHISPGQFTGFSPATRVFLQNLAANNNKTWFEAHRQDYQTYLLQPFQSLAAELGDFMLNIDPYFEVTPAIGRTISRIHRDTRFARDKSPYRSTMWLTFKRPASEWQDAPAYFFELALDSYRYGMGFYSASRQTMDNLRVNIIENSEVFLQAIAFYARQQDFLVEGETYKKTLKADLPPDLQHWYQRKNLYLVCNRRIDEHLWGRDLLRDLREGFTLIAPFYHYLWQIKSK